MRRWKDRIQRRANKRAAEGLIPGDLPGASPDSALTVSALGVRRTQVGNGCWNQLSELTGEAPKMRNGYPAYGRVYRYRRTRRAEVLSIHGWPHDHYAMITTLKGFILPDGIHEQSGNDD